MTHSNVPSQNHSAPPERPSDDSDTLSENRGPVSSKKVIISANPKSGSGQGRERIDQLAEILKESGKEVTVLTDLREVKRQVGQGVEEKQVPIVVAAGGDGTISLLVNSLPKETPFSILPLGTENLLSKYLGFDGSARQTADSVLQAQQVLLDAGLANDKIFLVMASCGFDADVVARMHRIRTGHIGRLSYLGPIFNSIRKYRFPNLIIKVDGKEFEQPAAWAFIFNFPQYAMNLPIITKGSATDGRLHLRTFRNGGLLKGIWYFLSVLFGQHEKWTNAQYLDGKQMEISCKSGIVPYQLDGDPGGTLPLMTSVLPARVRMLLTAEMKERLSED